MLPGESHVSRISKEYYVNYFNSSHRELGPPVVQAKVVLQKAANNVDLEGETPITVIKDEIAEGVEPRVRETSVQLGERHA